MQAHRQHHLSDESSIFLPFYMLNRWCATAHINLWRSFARYAYLWTHFKVIMLINFFGNSGLCVHIFCSDKVRWNLESHHSSHSNLFGIIYEKSWYHANANINLKSCDSNNDVDDDANEDDLFTYSQSVIFLVVPNPEHNYKCSIRTTYLHSKRTIRSYGEWALYRLSSNGKMFLLCKKYMCPQRIRH